MAASLALSLPIMISNSSISTAATNFSFCPISNFNKSQKIPIVEKQAGRGSLRKVSCKATEDVNDGGNTNTDESGKLDRRNVLIGLGGLYSVSGLRTALFASADPILPPDLSKCNHTPDLLPKFVDLDCCPPIPYKTFKPSGNPSSYRVRRPAHAVDAAYIRKYEEAVRRMKELPDDDPRSFKQQANVHCAYCNGGYDQVGFNVDIQVHESWLFFPFHRWYLYFYEKILGKLIDDPSFALPFWNWDHPDGMQMPRIYTYCDSPLYDKFRNDNHQPPTVVNLNYYRNNSTGGSDSDDTPPDVLKQRNLATMYRQMISNGKTKELFLGCPYHGGDQPETGGGSIENIPHGPIHVWTGDHTQPNNEDLGNFYSAGRDPIFFAHHSNIDRLWSVWKGLPQRGRKNRSKDFTDEDWLNSGFLFYNENAELVRVSVRDCLDTKGLGYVYQDVDLPWLRFDSKPKARIIPRAQEFAQNFFRSDGLITIDKPPNYESPMTLDKKRNILLVRPKKRDDEEEEEMLVLEGISFDRNQTVSFDVYVNDWDGKSGPEQGQCAGTFVNVPHVVKSAPNKKTCMRLGLSDLLMELGAENDEKVLVTLKPNCPKGGKCPDATIASIKIEYAS